MAIKPAKKNRQLPKVIDYTHTITDKVFGEFSVKKTANAWWGDTGKVGALINAYKYGCTNEEACISAGISENQRFYFTQVHPEFSSIIDACRQIPNLRARQTVVNQMATDGNLAFKWLERKLPEEFGNKREVVDNSAFVRVRMAEIKEKYCR